MEYGNQSRAEQFVQETFIDYENDILPRVDIVSDSNDPNTGKALGLYLPHSVFNQYETVGVNKSNGKITYKDQRVEPVKIYETARRTETLALYGWKVDTKGC